ncbi:MAG TPA: FtsX-like permease family protein [Terracidiphilus sp.]
MPALQRPRAAALAARSMNSGAHAWTRRCLVAGQIAISMILLTGAALLLRSFRNIEQQDIGMQTQGVLAVRTPLPRYRYTTAQMRMEFFLQAEQAMRRLPGVLTVGMSDTLPPAGAHHDQIYSRIAVDGMPGNADGTGGMVTWRWVTPEYFTSFDIPIIRGQAFTQDERTSSDRLVILSSLLASRLFGSQDPIGKRVQLGEGPWYTVSGIAANVKNGGLAGEDEPEYYRLRRNLAEDWNDDAVIVMKTALKPEAAAPWVRSQIAQLDPTVPVQIDMLSQTVSKLADRPRFETALLGFFAFCGLLMAVIGLYGVISFVAMQRTQEIGVRMALGATRVDILRLIAEEGVRLIFLGGVFGLGVSLATAQLLKSLLFNVAPRDPAIYASVVLLLALVALAATLIPARAAMKVEPVVALRYE